MTFIAHSSDMVAEARRLRAETPDLTYRAIGRMLGVHHVTVERWCDEDFRAHHNYACARRQRKHRRSRKYVPRTRVNWALADQMVELRQDDASYEAIKTAVKVFTGRTLSTATIKKVLHIVAPELPAKPRGVPFGREASK